MAINVTPIPKLTALAAPAFTLGTANAAGNALTAVASNSTLLAFDAVAVDAITFGQSGSVGSAAVAPRRDHVHAMASETVTGEWITTRDMTIMSGVTRVINNDAAVIQFDDGAVQTVQIPIPILSAAPTQVNLWFRAAAGNMVWRGDSSTGAAGQDPGANTDSVGDLTVTLASQKFTALDLVAAGLFTAETAGDMGGLNFTRVGDAAGDTIGGPVLLWGAEFVY